MMSATNGRYDFVTMIELLEHVSNPSEYLKGVRRVLKDDGYAYLTFALRMPQVDHLYQFDSTEDCKSLLYESGLNVIEGYCTIDTFKHFKEEDRWSLVDNDEYSATYCCLVNKFSAPMADSMVQRFNMDLD
jgi:ubiquinone/menaquinone biosynthesis C-methylase UbiE